MLLKWSKDRKKWTSYIHQTLLFAWKILLEIKAKLDKYYLDSAPSYGMVQKWFTEFRCSHTSTETIPSPGQPNEITTPEMINKIYDIVLNDLKVKVRETVKIVFVSTKREVNILNRHLCMRKLFARWMPRFLTTDQKRIRETTLQQNLAYFSRNPKEFVHQFVTMD